MTRSLALLLACMLIPAIVLAGGDPLDRSNVVWTSPSLNSSGSMPLGNGDIGLNVWVEQDGDLLFYISKTDAWSDSCRLLKLGRVRVKLSPNPFMKGLPFVQTLRLHEGEIEIVAGEAASAVTLRVWVDANHPVIHVEADGKQAFALEASLEVWRTADRKLEGQELFSAYGMNGAPHPTFEHRDVAGGSGDQITWYHRNPSSIWPEVLKLQGMEAWTKQAPDPLLDRTFGGAMWGQGLVSQGPESLKSSQPRTHHAVSIACLTAQTATPDEWRRKLDGLVAEAKSLDLDKSRNAHRKWWADFWDRSYVRVSGTGVGMTGGITINDIPLRIGADSNGQNLFHGLIRRARIFSHGLSPEQIAALAQSPDAAPPANTGLLGDWILDHVGGTIPNAALRQGSGSGTTGASMPAKISGELTLADAPGGKALRFDGKGFVEVAYDRHLDLTSAITLDAWICPDAEPGGGARIMDKCIAGTAVGYTFDTCPNNSLRFILDAGTISYDARLEPGKWHHVAAVLDGMTGRQIIYLDGKPVASLTHGGNTDEVTQGYALQRFVNACAGRGAFPIKFNGSIFTVDAKEGDAHYDGDYRRWGGPYWFQNTRLPYWPMLASGDYDMMLPLFRMYLAALPYATERCRTYYGHGGAFFPETMYFWGTNDGDDYGWDRKNKPVSQVDNGYIGRYWSGGIELLAMMLDYHTHTGDAAFAKSTLLPFADAIVTFYDKHYPRDEAGKLLFKPAQSLETWQDVINPLPEIAGLNFALGELLSLPADLTGKDRRAVWTRLRGELPPMPTKQIDGDTVLAPAREILGPIMNCENPELYAIFPYRLYGVGKPNLDLARRTFTHRRFKGSWGWQQDDTQAAYLGLAADAARLVAARFSMHNVEQRFPAFWGPNFDWVPDQDHGCNGLNALQTMLLQTDGRKLILFPAWPKQWDVEFKLHAPKQTVVEGVYRDGKMQSLRVTPESRRADVKIGQ